MGIGIPTAVFDELVFQGYLDRHLPAYRGYERVWLTHGSGVGKVHWRQPFPALFTSWGVVWRSLRSRVPDTGYRTSSSVTRIEPDADGVTVVTEHGAAERFDAVVGADGYRSLSRGLVDSGSRPVYAGYVVWRGDIDLPALAESAGMITACFPGGHGNFYPIVSVTGQPRVNWVIYGSIPEPYRFSDPQSLPPGTVPDELLKVLWQTAEEHLPPYWAEIVQATPDEAVSIQPLYDCFSDSYTGGRVLLAGDAGTVARPHTGGGAMKAMQDCLALQRICEQPGSGGWAEVLSAYDEQRRPACNALVELGRRLGRPLVTHSPAWDTMQEADFQAWYTATMAGASNPYDPVAEAEVK